MCFLFFFSAPLAWFIIDISRLLHTHRRESVATKFFCLQFFGKMHSDVHQWLSVDRLINIRLHPLQSRQRILCNIYTLTMRSFKCDLYSSAVQKRRTPKYRQKKMKKKKKTNIQPTIEFYRTNLLCRTQCSAVYMQILSVLTDRLDVFHVCQCF